MHEANLFAAPELTPESSPRMKRLAAIVTACLGFTAWAAELPPLDEVTKLVREHLPGVSAEQLQAASAEDLLAKLSDRVRLLEDYEEPAGNEPTLAAAELLENHFAYLRLAAVGGDAPTNVLQRLTELRANGAVTGCVLDLRFAGGRDFDVAARLAGVFLPANSPLFDWGDGLRLSSAPTNQFQRPLAVLINAQTRGAAEAVAASLRHSGAALLIGDTTAGEAAMVTDFNLSTGQRLRLTQGRVRLPDGQPLSSAGVVPDLRISLEPAVERAFLRDPFTAIRSQTNSPTATNSITTTVRVRKRLSEADLVRERERAAANPQPAPAQPELPDAPVVRDPVLARGLDFLKGQTLVRAQ